MHDNEFTDSSELITNMFNETIQHSWSCFRYFCLGRRKVGCYRGHCQVDDIREARRYARHKVNKNTKSHQIHLAVGVLQARHEMIKYLQVKNIKSHQIHLVVGVLQARHEMIKYLQVKNIKTHQIHLAVGVLQARHEMIKYLQVKNIKNHQIHLAVGVLQTRQIPTSREHQEPSESLFCWGPSGKARDDQICNSKD